MTACPFGYSNASYILVILAAKYLLVCVAAKKFCFCGGEGNKRCVSSKDEDTTGHESVLDSFRIGSKIISIGMMLRKTFNNQQPFFSMLTIDVPLVLPTRSGI